MPPKPKLKPTKEKIPLDPIIMKLEVYKHEFNSHVVQEQNKKLRREMWQMRDALKQLEGKYEKLSCSTEGMAYDVRKITAQNDAYRAELARLQKAKRQLQWANMDLLQDNEILQHTVAALRQCKCYRPHLNLDPHARKTANRQLRQAIKDDDDCGSRDRQVRWRDGWKASKVIEDEGFGSQDRQVHSRDGWKARKVTEDDDFGSLAKHVQRGDERKENQVIEDDDYGSLGKRVQWGDERKENQVIEEDDFGSLAKHVQRGDERKAYKVIEDDDFGRLDGHMNHSHNWIPQKIFEDNNGFSSLNRHKKCWDELKPNRIIKDDIMKLEEIGKDVWPKKGEWCDYELLGEMVKDDQCCCSRPGTAGCIRKGNPNVNCNDDTDSDNMYDTEMNDINQAKCEHFSEEPRNQDKFKVFKHDYDTTNEVGNYLFRETKSPDDTMKNTTSNTREHMNNNIQLEDIETTNVEEYKAESTSSDCKSQDDNLPALEVHVPSTSGTEVVSGKKCTSVIDDAFWESGPPEDEVDKDAWCSFLPT